MVNILWNDLRTLIKNLRKMIENPYSYGILFICIIISGCQTSSATPGETSSNPLGTIAPSEGTASESTNGVTVELITPVARQIGTVSSLTITQTPSMSTLSSVDSFVLYGANVNGEEHIYSLSPGGESKFIVTGSLLYGQGISPNGTKIVIDKTDRSQSVRSPENVFIYDLELEIMLPLNLLAYPSSGIFWSKDESYLLYIAKNPNETSDQLILYDITTNKNQVLAEMEEILVTAGWSEDGKEIAFVAKENEQYDLFTINSKTLEQKQITDNPDIETMILWNPITPQLLVGTVLDERSAFEGWPWGIERLYLFDKEDNDWNWLADKFLTSESISWSPEGKEILFENSGLLCIMDTESLSETCPLNDNPFFNDHLVSFRTKPVWSDDRKWVAFYAIKQSCITIYFLEMETNLVVSGDLGCDTTQISSSSPIYWSLIR